MIRRATGYPLVSKFSHNPVLRLELNQTWQSPSMPMALATVTITMALLLLAIGTWMGKTAWAAGAGGALMQVCFSLAFYLVATVGAVASSTAFAGERSSRAWELVTLTRLSSEQVVFGKFLAALAIPVSFAVILAPVAMLAYLFGGISLAEILVGWIWLAGFCIMFTALGLAVGSVFASPGAAVLTCLLSAAALSVGIHVGGGLLMSVAAHQIWPAVTPGLPIWLPTALLSAPIGFSSIVLLVLLPTLSLLLASWFLYEIALANARSVTDDRSTRLRRWLLISLPVFGLVLSLACVALPSSPRWAFSTSIWMIEGLSTFVVLVSIGEPFGPSRRVRLSWERAGKGPWARRLGPGLMAAMTSVLLAGEAALVLITAFALVSLLSRHDISHRVDLIRIAIHAGYAIGLLVFVVGAAAALRSFSRSAKMPRLLLLGCLLAAAVGPWAAYRAGVMAAPSGFRAILLSSPSPLFAAYLGFAVAHFVSLPVAEMWSAGISISLWLLSGIALLVVARRRCRQALEQHHWALKELEQELEVPAVPGESVPALAEKVDPTGASSPS